MTVAATIPFNEFLAGQNSESTSLIPFFGDNGFLGDRLNRFDGGGVGLRCLADPVKYRTVGGGGEAGIQKSTADDQEAEYCNP